MKQYVAAHLKDMNRKVVYKLVSSVKEISKAEISRQTGISSPTVIKIVNFLMEHDILYEGGEGSSSIGRKPQILKFNPDAAFSFGIDFEGDFMKIGIVNLDNKIKCISKIRITSDFNEFVKEKLGEYLNKFLEDAAIDTSKVLGIGIGIPGVVDPKNKIIDFAPLIGINETIDCNELFGNLKSKTGFDVCIENDVDASAIGEYTCYGQESGRDMIYVSLGTGLGSGIILDGKLRRGVNNSAGEIGYMVFDKNFETKKNDAGWMEREINLKALQKKWEFDPSKDIPEILSEDLILMIDHIASKLGIIISNLSISLDIDLFVLGGITVEILGENLIKAVQKYVDRLSFEKTEIKLQNNKNPGVIGAASLLTEKKIDVMLAD